MTDQRPMSFVVAMKDFFGLKEGQQLSEFATEMRSLPPQDKAYFTLALTKAGYNLTGIAA